MPSIAATNTYANENEKGDKLYLRLQGYKRDVRRFRVQQKQKVCRSTTKYIQLNLDIL